MIQLYPITLFIIALSALFSFSAVFKAELSFLFSFKELLKKNEKRKIIIFYSLLFIALLKLLFPLYPGPMILGDLLISASLVFSAFLFKKDDESSNINDSDIMESRKFKEGIFFTLVFALHLIFPSFIIL